MSWWRAEDGSLLSPEGLREALARGVDVNRAATGQERTALHHAAVLGDLAAAIVLTDGGAANAAFDTENRSPLALAARPARARWLSRSTPLRRWRYLHKTTSAVVTIRRNGQGCWASHILGGFSRAFLHAATP